MLHHEPLFLILITKELLRDKVKILHIQAPSTMNPHLYDTQRNNS